MRLAKQIIGAFGLAAFGPVAPHDDASIREVAWLGDGMQLLFPARSSLLGSDQSATYIGSSLTPLLGIVITVTVLK